jgi:hypothetical protein
MKKFLIVITLFVVAGCNEGQKTPSRDQVSVGMSYLQIIELYGVKINDSNTFKYLPKISIVNELQENQYTYETYRYWLADGWKKQPFLLTFQSRKLTTDEVEQERQRKIADVYSDPNFIKEVNVLTTPEDRDTLANMLVWGKEAPADRTSRTLVKITLDEQMLIRREMRRQTNLLYMQQ